MFCQQEFAEPQQEPAHQRADNGPGPFHQPDLYEPVVLDQPVIDVPVVLNNEPFQLPDLYEPIVLDQPVVVDVAVVLNNEPLHQPNLSEPVVLHQPQLDEPIVPHQLLLGDDIIIPVEDPINFHQPIIYNAPVVPAEDHVQFHQPGRLRIVNIRPIESLAGHSHNRDSTSITTLHSRYFDPLRRGNQSHSRDPIRWSGHQQPVIAISRKMKIKAIYREKRRQKRRRLAQVFIY